MFINSSLSRIGFVSWQFLSVHYLGVFLRNHLLFAVVLCLGAWESQYCQQMKSTLNSFSSPLVYQKVIKKSWPGFRAETFDCCDTTQRKVHLGLFTCCDIWKATYPHLGHPHFAFHSEFLVPSSKQSEKEIYAWLIHLSALWLMTWSCPSFFQPEMFSFFLFLCQVHHESTAPLIGVCRISLKSLLTALMRSFLMPEVSIIFYLPFASYLHLVIFFFFFLSL